jgi:hypothetical protein
MSYPDNFLRGISDKNLVSDGAILAAAFYFTKQSTMDQWEQSICWEDDESVIPLMKSQQRNSEIQFKAGIARIPTNSINYINALPRYRRLLIYERKELEGNPYHGNLLLDKDTSQHKMRLIAAVIAVHFSDFISQ